MSSNASGSDQAPGFRQRRRVTNAARRAKDSRFAEVSCLLLSVLRARLYERLEVGLYAGWELLLAQGTPQKSLADTRQSGDEDVVVVRDPAASIRWLGASTVTA